MQPLPSHAPPPSPPPQAIVDIATLTGACIIALGGEVAGLFTPSDDMADALGAASKAVGEKVWRMPMEASYAEQLKSSVADMKNTGERGGSRGRGAGGGCAGQKLCGRSEEYG